MTLILTCNLRPKNKQRHSAAPIAWQDLTSKNAVWVLLMLPLQWNPPITRTDWNRWGSTCQDFALIFSFWSRWTQKQNNEAVRIYTWTQALALFVRHGGAIADFLQQCQFVGMAAYKLRILTSFLFQTQHQNPILGNLPFSNHDQTKWLESLPNETAFPESLFFIPKWDLTKASAQLPSSAR